MPVRTGRDSEGGGNPEQEDQQFAMMNSSWGDQNVWRKHNTWGAIASQAEHGMPRVLPIPLPSTNAANGSVRHPSHPRASWGEDLAYLDAG